MACTSALNLLPSDCCRDCHSFLESPRHMASTMKVLVTGASGLVGRAVTEQLLALGGYEVLAMTRTSPARPVPGARYMPVGDMTLNTDWQSALTNVQTVVHAAARVHVLNDHTARSLARFERVNVEVALKLARQAALAGVRRFVFLSSIGVNGVRTEVDSAFSETDQPQPHNPYAHSKLKAELGLRQIAGETGLEVVIIRPPLVYGPGVRANFAALMRAVQRGWPLPLGAVHNFRSMVGIDNLVDLIITCLKHPKAANQTFLVSDGHDLSSAELVRGLAREAGWAHDCCRCRRGFCGPVPPWWGEGT
ncbi:MAG: NAD-dependent epimerase/dehydratase family protein [Rhodoferax sp.]